MKFSWSQLQSALACGQRWDYTYRQNLERKPTRDSKARLRGTLFHAGMESALRASIGTQFMVGAAEFGVNMAAEAEMTKWLELSDYCELVQEMAQEVIGYLRFFIPLIGIGTRYQVYQNMIEFNFLLPDGFSGKIDAVLQDTETGELLLVDWKLRAQYGAPDLAALDGQLYAYAYALSELGIIVDEVALIEFRAKLPSRASMQMSKGVATGLPNIGAASYDTTWDVWAADVRSYGTDPEKYRDQIEPKLKSEADYYRITRGVVNDDALETTRETLAAAQAQLAFYETQQVLPAAYSSYACAFCDFRKLCELKRYKYDDSFVRGNEYAPRKSELPIDIE